MIDPLDRPSVTSKPTAEDPAEPLSDLVALVSVGEESYEQVRLMNGIDHVPTTLRTLREHGFDLVGTLFMPRGCEVEVDFRSDSAFGSKDEDAPRVVQVMGVVRKAVMLDAQPSYVLQVHVPADHLAELARLRSLLEA